jgi:hypothetical protein
MSNLLESVLKTNGNRDVKEKLLLGCQNLLRELYHNLFCCSDDTMPKTPNLTNLDNDDFSDPFVELFGPFAPNLHRFIDADPVKDGRYE